jgi:hypothetical protein
MMNAAMKSALLTGLCEGQVLQRRGAKGADVEIGFDVRASGSVFATICRKGNPLDMWNRRKVCNAKAGKSNLARLRNIPAGGPYSLRFQCESGDEILHIKSFYVGDVWLMAGQSNMQGCGHIDHAAKPHALIRLFSMRREWRIAKDPLHVRPESPDACHNGGRQCRPEEGEILRKTCVRGVGAGIFFAKEMLKRSGVPQGLIAAAHGGTTMDQWSPSRRKEGADSLYASMMTSVKATGQPLAGLLWYQGESDARGERALAYTKNMIKLVAAIRRDLSQTGLPVVAVQIGRVHRKTTTDQANGWKSVQDQQRLLPDKIPNLEIVSTIDLAMDDSIHIGGQGHARLGIRMARCADYLVNGNHQEQAPPKFHGLSEPRMKEGEFSAIDVHFKNVSGRLRSGSAPAGFSICDADGRDLNLIYKTSLLGSTVRLHVPHRPPLGSFLWHARERTAYCNITDDRDYVLPVFGPIPVGKRIALLPFLTRWRVTDIMESREDFGLGEPPNANRFDPDYKIYAEDGFINERNEWMGRSGQCYFATSIVLPEPMKLEFLMGYDGPFQIWMDRKLVFRDLKGTNPCFPDESSRVVSVSSGKHEICVGMDLCRGTAWGFYLRLARRDVSTARLRSGDFPKPILPHSG